MEKLKEKRGITLIALVITIVIIIILSMVAISMVMGDNGLIKQAEKGKNMTEIEDAREKLTIILGEAFIDKKTNKEYNENEYLNKFIEEREPNVSIEEKEIELNGHIFELNRKVPELGVYTGELKGPRIKEIKVTEETESSVKVEVITKNAEGAKYTYSYKKEGETNWQIITNEEKENTCTINNLSKGIIYNIKVEVKNENGKSTKQTNAVIGKIPQGAITFGEVKWNGGKASTTVKTEKVGFQLQYQIGNINGTWINISGEGKIDNLNHGETVYARLYDGRNESEPASLTIQDKIAPTISNIEESDIKQNSITVKVIANDNESGISEYKYYINNESTPKEISGNNSYTYTGLDSSTEYTIKVEVKDKAGQTATASKTIKTKGITVTVDGEVTGETIKLTKDNFAQYLGKEVTNYKDTTNKTERVTVQTPTNPDIIYNNSVVKTFTVSTIYRLFYVDFEGKYGDNEKGTIYLKADIGNSYASRIDVYKNKTTDANIIKRYNPELYKNGKIENNISNPSVTWLLDSNEWNELKESGEGTEIGNKVKEVVGAPSIEMYMDSYNAKYELTGDEPIPGSITENSERKKLFYKCETGANGYLIGPGENYSYGNSIDRLFPENKDSVFYRDVDGLHIASPMKSSYGNVLIQVGLYDIYSGSTSNKKHLCPIVAISSDVLLDLK